MIAAILRRLSLTLYGLGDAIDRVAERIAPSTTTTTTDAELAPALRVERFRYAELEAEAARQQERVVAGYLRVIPGGGL